MAFGGKQFHCSMSCDYELANEKTRCSGKNASYITNKYVCHLRTGFKKKSHFFRVLSVHAYIDLLILFIVLLTPAFDAETVCIIYTKTSSVSFRSSNCITRSIFIVYNLYNTKKESLRMWSIMLKNGLEIWFVGVCRSYTDIIKVSLNYYHYNYLLQFSLFRRASMDSSFFTVYKN